MKYFRPTIDEKCLCSLAFMSFQYRVNWMGGVARWGHRYSDVDWWGRNTRLKFFKPTACWSFTDCYSLAKPSIYDGITFSTETWSLTRKTRYFMPREKAPNNVSSVLNFTATWYCFPSHDSSLSTHLFSLNVFPSLPFAAETRTPVLNDIGLGKLLSLTLAESTLCFNWCDCMCW